MSLLAVTIIISIYTRDYIDYELAIVISSMLIL